VLAQAQRPLIVLGKGAAYAQADGVIRKFVEVIGIPFLPVSMAEGLAAELATRPWGFAAVVRRCQVRARRHRGVGIRQ
jgi:thiamine pyrophosphate-dependent acetolactate synthase large subunit-like protein